MKKLSILLLFASAIVLSSCGEKTPLSEENKVYAGTWVANDGTWVRIYNDGGGDFELSSSNVSGGSTTFTDSTLEIGIMGLGATFSLGAPPYEADGKWVLELDGIDYVKE